MNVGDRLREARNRMKLNFDQVSKQTGIGSSSLCEYEKGKRELRVSQLRILADVYRRPLDFFLSDDPIREEKILWRCKPNSPTAEDIEGQFLQLCEQFHNLEVWCNDQKSWSLPEAEAAKSKIYQYRDAEALAYKVASALKLGDRPGQSLLWVLEEVCGIKVFHLPFEPEGAAACTRGEFGAAILLNSNHVRWRLNFDLAHELFHLLTWHIFRTGKDGEAHVPSDVEEKLATCFASHILMPSDVTRLAISEIVENGEFSFDDLFDVARQFDVSVEALLWRMVYLLNRGEEQTRKNIEHYKGLTCFIENRENEPPPSRPLRFRALAMKALHRAEISLGRFAEYMGISRREAQVYLEQEGVEDDQITIAST